MTGVLEATAEWPVPNVSAVVIGLEGVRERAGDQEKAYRLASVTKLLSAYALLIAVEEEAVSLEDPVGPEGATLRHLLAHASGVGLNAGDPPLGPPGRRRGYSNAGIELAAAHLTEATGIDFGTYLAEAVLEPLNMAATELRDSPAHGAWSTANDLTAFVDELFAPKLMAPATFAEMVTVQFPGLAGIMPGVGRFDPLDWGLGFERTFGREKHWAGSRVSGQAFGHFGAGGTFLWLDPRAQVASVVLTDRDFGDWSLSAWPRLGDEVIEAATT